MVVLYYLSDTHSIYEFQADFEIGNLNVDTTTTTAIIAAKPPPALLSAGSHQCKSQQCDYGRWLILKKSITCDAHFARGSHSLVNKPPHKAVVLFGISNHVCTVGLHTMCQNLATLSVENTKLNMSASKNTYSVVILLSRYCILCHCVIIVLFIHIVFYVLCSVRWRKPTKITNVTVSITLNNEWERKTHTFTCHALSFLLSRSSFFWSPIYITGIWRKILSPISQNARLSRMYVSGRMRSWIHKQRGIIIIHGIHTWFVRGRKCVVQCLRGANIYIEDG